MLGFKHKLQELWGMHNRYSEDDHTAVMLCASLAVASLQSNRNWRTSAVEVLTTNDNQRQMDMGQNCSKYTTLTMRILTMLSAENSNGNGLEYRTVTHIQTM